jgi:hypothetical protein
MQASWRHYSMQHSISRFAGAQGETADHNQLNSVSQLLGPERADADHTMTQHCSNATLQLLQHCSFKEAGSDHNTSQHCSNATLQHLRGHDWITTQHNCAAFQHTAASTRGPRLRGRIGSQCNATLQHFSTLQFSRGKTQITTQSSAAP